MAYRQQQSTIRQIVGTLAVAALVTACTTAIVRPPAIPALENQSEQSIPDIDPLHISSEMKQFVDHHVENDKNREGKAWLLAYAALDPYLLHFDYDPRITLPAEEAFRTRKGNCLTFSSLFIAMARHAGLQAWYQEVQVPPEWSTVDDTLLVSKHVNAVVRDRSREYVVDVSRRKSRDSDIVRRLSDAEAEAQYYNNLGADALIGGDLPLAYAYFSKALEKRPGLAYIWSNLGVVFRRNEQTGDAILSYRTALQFNPAQSVAMNNLYTLYEEEGNIEAAQGLQRRVENNRRKNPYYLHYLAEVANEERRWSDAIKLLNRAIQLESHEYRFYYSLAQAQYHAGKFRVAQTSLDRARTLAPPDLQEGILTLPGAELP